MACPYFKTLSSSFAYHPSPAASIGYPPTSPLALMLRVVQLTVFVMTLAFLYMSVSCPSGLCFSASLPLVTSQARLESDVLESQLGVTAGNRVCSRLWEFRTGIQRSLLSPVSRLGSALGLH